MKKLLCALCALIILILSSCNHGSVANEDPVNDNPAASDSPVSDNPVYSDPVSDDPVAEAQYFTQEALCYPFQNGRELAEEADLVFTGRVTGIFFQVLDDTNALPPTEKTEKSRRRLYTIYDIDVAEIYKGENRNSIQFRVAGGVRDYRAEEQMKLMKNMDAWPDDGILLQEGMPEIKIGEVYLFALGQFKTGLPTNFNPRQSFYNLRDPFKKNCIANREPDDPAEYYSEDKDANGSSIISAKDVISAFGEQAWDAFWAQWQKDNPDWETWLDKAAVEKALAG
ncbi:MAG: hypothetical protein FWE80_04505 [Oscillospiraceae bacterium]|nr:hypothetical protein [Oscillospiraceae bacterium]